MKLDTFALKQLVDFINEHPIRRSGPMLVELFSEFGYRDVYGSGFPSRKDYTFKKLQEMNDSNRLVNLVNYLSCSRYYADTNYSMEEIHSKLDSIIKHCGYSLELNENDEYIVTGSALLEEETTVEVAFEDIQKDILSYIEKAEYHIWLSIAWFTDPVLFNALKEKATQGVNVQVILNNDSINNNANLPFETYFETYRKDPFGYFGNNILHHKFCVIDLKYVLHGSYNWTNKAQFNHEEMTSITNREIAEKFAKRFVELKLK